MFVFIGKRRAELALLETLLLEASALLVACSSLFCRTFSYCNHLFTCCSLLHCEVQTGGNFFSHLISPVPDTYLDTKTDRLLTITSWWLGENMTSFKALTKTIQSQMGKCGLAYCAGQCLFGHKWKRVDMWKNFPKTVGKLWRNQFCTEILSASHH